MNPSLTANRPTAEQLAQHRRWEEARVGLNPDRSPPPVVRSRPFQPSAECVRAIRPERRPPKRPRDVLSVSSDQQAVDAAVWVDPDWLTIAKEVSLKHRVAMNDLISIRRARHVVLARQELAYRLVKETALSMPQIGHRLGRDHTTILHSVRRHEERVRAGQG